MTGKIGIIYGSTTGNTEHVAEQIAQKLGERAVLHNLAEQGVEGITEYAVCLCGIATWDFGELQEDWADHWEQLAKLNWRDKPCALFGLGDQIGYGEWFLDAMGLLHTLLVQSGAHVSGYWPCDGYKFEASKALTPEGDHFVGLALDEDSQAAETDERIEQWLKSLTEILALS